jgi:uncharacterized protein (UPF0335 family)
MAESLQASSQAQLRQFVEAIERLEEDKRNLARDIREKYSEAEGEGFDKHVLREVVKVRRKSEAERQEEESLLDIYLHALGTTEEVA